MPFPERFHFFPDRLAVSPVGGLEFFALVVVKGGIPCGAGDSVAAEGEEMAREGRP